MSTTDAGRGRDAALEAGDALRAYALMAVVVFHIAAGVVILDTRSLDFQASYGHVGGSLLFGLQTSVYVFFALSAFLLSRPFVRAALGGAPLPSVRRYARHRAGRILPAFWAACAVVLILYGMQGSGIGQVFALVTLTQVYHHGAVASTIDHAWSLNVEALFYILLVPLAAASAWLVRRHRRGGIAAVALVGLVAVVGAIFGSAGLDVGVPVSQSPLAALRTFLPGVALAVLAVRRPVPGTWRVPDWVSPALLVVGLVLLWRTPVWAPEGNDLRLTLGTACGACLLASVVTWQYTGRPVWRAFRGPLVAWVGERSYSIFLVHGIVIWELHDVGASAGSPARHVVISLILMLPAIMLAAQVLHVTVERPMMLRSRRPRAGDRRPAISEPDVPVARPEVAVSA